MVTEAHKLESAIGCSAILRVSGFPIRFWTAAGNPDMFQALRELNHQQEHYNALGKTIADRIGSELIPHAHLSRSERALALELRRHLFNGILIGEADCQQLVRIADRLLGSPNQLSGEIEHVHLCAKELIVLETQAVGSVAQEHVRVLRGSWDTVHSTFVAQAMLKSINLPLYQDIKERLDRCESWESKRLRQRSDYIWRLITRATTKSTPRGWFGHIALLPITAEVDTSALVAVTSEFATEWMQNIHFQRKTLWQAALEQDDPAIRLTIAPIHWLDNDHIQFWVVDPIDPTRMGEVDLRRTDLLEAIYNALVSGPGTIDKLAGTILATPDVQQRTLLRKFVEHLVNLGALQISLPPRNQLGLWNSSVPMTDGHENINDVPQYTPLSNERPTSSERRSLLDQEPHASDEGYLDVYRQVNGFLSQAACLDLQSLVQQALRVLSLITADQSATNFSLVDELDEHPQPVLEIMRHYLDTNETLPRSRRNPLAWPTPVNECSAYARLIEWIAARANDSPVLNLNPKLLDTLEADVGAIDWPLDCILRMPCPGVDFTAVLDQVVPAGALDARFVTTLRRLYRHVPHADAYHRFLKELEAETGITFVEMLIPPLSNRAANAVRRPIYTSTWTGDADIQTFCPQDRDLPRYIPLDAITIRRANRLCVEAYGRPIWPIYHATRSPQPPWNIITELLLAPVPRLLGWSPRQLYNSLDLFPERNFMPRITIDHKLVLSCAQWRIAIDQLWDASSSEFVKAKKLEELRRRLQMPRWVFVVSSYSSKPMPCDLESLRTLQILDRLCQAGSSTIIAVEMLPSPDQLLVKDGAHQLDDRLVSEILLRLPCDESPSAMAKRIARRIDDHYNSDLYHIPRMELNGAGL